MNVLQESELEQLRTAGAKISTAVYSDKYKMWFKSQEIKDKVEKHWCRRWEV